jgi:hypothetical protein
MVIVMSAIGSKASQRAYFLSLYVGFMFVSVVVCSFGAEDPLPADPDGTDFFAPFPSFTLVTLVFFLGNCGTVPANPNDEAS